MAGPLAVAGACLCRATDNNLTQRVSGGDPVQIAAVKGLVAGSVNTGITLALGGGWLGAGVVAGAMAVGLASYGASLVLYVRALRELGTARTGAYFSLAPFVGAAASVLLWREPVTASLAAAGALMGAGAWLHQSERYDHFPVHEPLEHVHAHVHDAHHRHDHRPEDPAGEPHAHVHQPAPLAHRHPHYPDIHHRHGHIPAPGPVTGGEGARGPVTRAPKRGAAFVALRTWSRAALACLSRSKRRCVAGCFPAGEPPPLA